MIDAHCHLDDKAFKHDLDDVVERAKKELKAVFVASSSFSSNAKNLAMHEKHNEFIHPCFGMYPGNVIKENKLNEAIDFIRNNKKSTAAIGEIGLDYYWFKLRDEKDVQMQAFKSFIELANELKKPIVVHSRDAENEVLDVLEKESNTDVMLHCFTGTEEQAKRTINLGYYLSFSTRLCWLKNSKGLITTVPLDNILAETDSPYNHPQRAGRNEPINVRFAYELIAETKKIEFSETERVIDRNADKFFKTRI